MCAYFLSYGYVTWSKLKVVWRALGLEIIICSRYNENRRHLHMLMDVKLKLVCAFLAFWRAKIRQRGICISNTKTEFNANNQIYNSLQSALRRNSFVMKRWRFYFYFRVDQIRQSTNKIPLMLFDKVFHWRSLSTSKVSRYFDNITFALSDWQLVRKKVH